MEINGNERKAIPIRNDALNPATTADLNENQKDNQNSIQKIQFLNTLQNQNQLHDYMIQTI